MIAFPIANPAGLVPVQVEDHALERAPTWNLDTLHTGPARSSPAYESLLDETVGSSYDWGDELRFDKRSGLLRSFILKTPEAGGIEHSIVSSWLALPRHVGLPTISDDRGFNLDPLDVRSLSDDGRHLLALHATATAPDRDALRLAVHPDCDFLFAHGRYCGWVLGRPIAHLTQDRDGDAAAGSPDDSQELIDLLRDYLALVVQPNIDRMDDRDPLLGAALEALIARARSCRVPGPAAQTLVWRATDVLENFYG